MNGIAFCGISAKIFFTEKTSQPALSVSALLTGVNTSFSSRVFNVSTDACTYTGSVANINIIIGRRILIVNSIFFILYYKIT